MASPVDILLIVATSTGTSTDVADAVAEYCREAGFSARVSLADARPHPEDGQVIGLISGVKAGHWHSALRDYAVEQHDELEKHPLVAVSVCLNMVTSGSYERSERYSSDAMESLGLHAEANVSLPGRYIPSQHTFLERQMMRGVGTPEGDFRDPERERAVAELLMGLVSRDESH